MLRTALILSALVTLAVATYLGAPVGADDPSYGSPTASAPIDLQNAKCPVKGTPVAEGVTATVNNAVVHFCCNNCAAKYRANPQAYEAALRADPAVSKRLDEAIGTRPSMSEPSMSEPSMSEPSMSEPSMSEPSMSEPVPAASTPFTESKKGSAFHDAMRKLWSDHVLYTRLFIISAVGNLPDKDATTDRLMKNQEEIGNAIRPIYGEDAGTKLTALLKDHISTAADLVTASAAGDTAKADAASKKWSANADDLAAFLNGANPRGWSLEVLKSMLYEHLDLTRDEATARIKKDWNADIAAYDKIHEQALRMADMLSDGIRNQFPDKFP